MQRIARIAIAMNTIEAIVSLIGDVPCPNIKMGIAKNTSIRKVETSDNERKIKVMGNSNVQSHWLLADGVRSTEAVQWTAELDDAFISRR